MKEKRLFVVVHEHRYGTSTYMVRSESMPDEDRVVTKCDIDFEPNRGEVITIGEVDGQVIDIDDDVVMANEFSEDDRGA